MMNFGERLLLILLLVGGTIYFVFQMQGNEHGRDVVGEIVMVLFCVIPMGVAAVEGVRRQNLRELSNYILWPNLLKAGLSEAIIFGSFLCEGPIIVATLIGVAAMKIGDYRQEVPRREELQNLRMLPWNRDSEGSLVRGILHIGAFIGVVAGGMVWGVSPQTSMPALLCALCILQASDIAFRPSRWRNAGLSSGFITREVVIYLAMATAFIFSLSQVSP